VGASANLSPRNTSSNAPSSNVSANAASPTVPTAAFPLEEDRETATPSQAARQPSQPEPSTNTPSLQTKPRFQQCYARELAIHSFATGAVRLIVRVGSDGSVVEVRVSSAAGGLSSQAVQCVIDQMRLARFSKPDAGSATVHVPVTFVIR
jgi:septal ring-binding cell division protein DamX